MEDYEKNQNELIEAMQRRDIIQHIYNRLEYDRSIDILQRAKLSETLKILEDAERKNRD